MARSAEVEAQEERHKVGRKTAGNSAGSWVDGEVSKPVDIRGAGGREGALTLTVKKIKPEPTLTRREFVCKYR